MKSIAIILTVYNRCVVTCNGLESLYKAIYKFNNNYCFDIYMTNDGCTDETPQIIQNKFPEIKIINHPGGLFWSRGMNLAWKEALKHNSYDYFIWFNDDAILQENALSILINSINELNNEASLSMC